MTDSSETAKLGFKDAGRKTVPSLWTMMKEKALETGVQGVPNIGRARHLFRKMFWIIVVFAGTGECSLN